MVFTVLKILFSQDDDSDLFSYKRAVGYAWCILLAGSPLWHEMSD